MQEEDIGNHLYWDSLTSRTHKAVHSPSRQQTSMTGRKCLPNARQHDQDGENQADSAAPEDIAQGHDEEVRKAKRDDGNTGKHRQLVVIEVEFAPEEREHGRNRQGTGDGNPCEEPLARHNGN